MKKSKIFSGGDFVSDGRLRRWWETLSPMVGFADGRHQRCRGLGNVNSVMMGGVC